MRKLLCLLLTAWLLTPAQAGAQTYDPGGSQYLPTISPNPVTQGISARLNLSVNLCRHETGGYQVSSTGDVVDVRLTLAPPEHICPPIVVVSAPVSIALPALPAGEYTVRFVFRNPVFPEDNPPVLLGLTVLPPRVVPAVDWSGYSLLILLVGITGLLTVRRRYGVGA
jgi:hypothetical protein